MRRVVLIIPFLFILVLISHHVWADAGALPETSPSSGSGTAPYCIGPGDILEITVWENADLSRQRSVLPDGTITLLLLGSFVAAGKTVTTLGRELSEKLIQFVLDPIATVSVLQPNSLNIYVIGKVHNPGRFQLVGSVDVFKALAM
nr:polysaccharide biosynthesis/export family protein [Desulfobulbaceae bacterium]